MQLLSHFETWVVLLFSFLHTALCGFLETDQEQNGIADLFANRFKFLSIPN